VKIDRSPKHGSSPRENESVSQTDGTAAENPRGTTQPEKNSEQNKQSSGAGSAANTPRLRSDTPENREGSINPSAPTQATGGPSTNLPLPENPNSDAIGEIHHPDPRGNLDMGKMSNPPGTNTGHAINPGEQKRAPEKAPAKEAGEDRKKGDSDKRVA
jgi:hypothetical protein